MTTTTDTTFLLETDAEDAAVQKAAEKARKAAERAAAKQAKADEKAAAAAAKVAAAADALTVTVAAVGEYNEADDAARRAAEAATGTPLANVMIAIARALDSGVQAKALAEAGVAIAGKAIKADTVAKYAIGGRALLLGGDLPDLLTNGSVAHRVRACVEAAIGRKVGRKEIGTVIDNSTTIAAAVAGIDALEGQPADDKEPTLADLLAAIARKAGRLADAVDAEEVTIGDIDDAIVAAHDGAQFLLAIKASLVAVRDGLVGDEV